MSDAEAISTPCEPGGFVGDIYFGHPLKSTMGTHRWSGSEWVALPSVVEALAGLLAKARAEAAALRERVARLEGALRHYRETLCEGFCGEDMWADEGHSHPEIQRDCGGCLAASVLLSAALTDGGKDG